MVSLQKRLTAPIVARGDLIHSGPKDAALNEFARQLWMILQSQSEGYRQLHVQYSGSNAHGTGMAADADRIVAYALRLVKMKWPEKGGGSISYQLQLSILEAETKEVGDDS
jgi:hypothetical protein